MDLRLRRLVRTASSEQYALFDLEQGDVEDAPGTVGKLDLHYTAEGLYGTLLLWDEEAGRLTDEQREDFVYTLLDELSLPMGVPNEYVVEFFAPNLDRYTVFHNVGLDDVEDAAAEGEDLQVDDDVADSVESNVDGLSDIDVNEQEEGVESGRNSGSPPESGDEARSGAEATLETQQAELGEPLPEFDVKPED